MMRLLPRRPTPAEEANEYPTAMYRSAPRIITPQERCDLSLALTGPVPIEVRENHAINWPPVGVLLSRPSSVQLIKESKSGCLSLLAVNAQV